jgi:hypothetical protein
MKKIILILLFGTINQLIYSQNSCLNAQIVTAGITSVSAISGTNAVTPCSTSSATYTNWYAYTPSQNYTVTVSSDLSVNICKDTNLSIYSGSCSNLSCVTSDDDSGVIACNNGNTYSYLSVASFTALAGVTYYIAWDNKWSALGFDFQITESAVVLPPITFTPATISSTSSICSVADMNGDYLDDIVTVETNQMTVLTQKSIGGFNSNVYSLPNLTANPSWSIAAGDFDKNGYNDLVFGSSSKVAVIKANSTGTGYTEIAYPQSIFTQRTNFVDINNDGNLDLWACHDTAQSHAYRNDGAGNLNFDISLMPTLAVGGNYQSQWSDLDNDGDIDMYLSKCRGGAAVGDPQRINLFYKNNGNGTYTESGAVAGINDGSQSWSSAIEDYDNDGDMDILLSNISDTNKFYRNNGNGTFTDIYSSTGINAQVGSWELQAADFNNDGWIDFLWQNGKELYLNNGNLTFTGYDLSFSEGAIGDLNNDGFLDVQFNNQVYYNTPNGNNWVKINLQGIQSNRNGIGAKVEIYGAWGKQIREIKSGNGFSHQSTLNAHFGIGTETIITKVVVKWPSGIIDTYMNPGINQSLLAVEGATLAINTYTNDSFSLYPNPAKDIVTIKIKDGIEFSNAKIFDLNGKLIAEPKLNSDSFSVQNINTGTYIILFRDQNGKDYSQKFIKE